jgi:hypothetical protein
MDWGTVPAWVGAVGSVAAFGLATLIYWRNSVLESKTQARLVFPVVRPNSMMMRPEGDVLQSWGLKGDKMMRASDDVERLCDRSEWEYKVEYRTRGPVMQWMGYVQNNSEEPIVGVVVGLAVGKKVWETQEPVGHIEPGGEVVSSRYFTHPPAKDYFEGNLFTIVWFTDAAGIRWMRRLDQPLKKVSRRSQFSAGFRYRVKQRFADRRAERSATPRG